jgi:transcriptional regulator with XRE-family HTH domain
MVYPTELVTFKKMANRIKEVREYRKLSQDRLGALIGTTGQQIGRLEKEDRGVDLDWLYRIASGLRVSPVELLVLEHGPVRVRISGQVQAGSYEEPGTENDYGNDPDEFVDVPLPDQYRKFRVYAVRVVGSSMNLIYPEGALLICAHLEELKEQPQHGRKYIVAHTRADGRVEKTVKEFALDNEGRPWAWPRSTDPSYQAPYPLFEALDDETIALESRVLWSLKPE